ncbi:hypothetical protein MJO29_012547 [Puccinia striiformis f. sp. tritici]|uniref:ATP11 protein n=1 Tax=Puccinia striiformis f. sp. tritici PST-78 TaxID=1165861 RepID=A0A0L0VDF0_9BASI|nr:hypothetical protein Pst134EA_023206 [Puccinia striiformis f. sp. tritici]KAI9623752.1 hypothetical protein H4Q26_014482 [Puccinia striiformis f. sp. tritici PST-130]KNE97221.1 hypothetical protein PSTG_09483 [Puccinia striiformis f. sp. tritici PST-78]KAH9446205.1 hypothetical protein Pst134EB_024023 [Puccinia striiformis f. sp. tritici]KAH9455754.1 hypothetical protein Pst134EA_023206 [Puccinia striiformis f. sp. tritici]KAI7946159.1 hypothetical protein MJO29_012547 [Puccinia striiformis
MNQLSHLFGLATRPAPSALLQSIRSRGPQNVAFRCLRSNHSSCESKDKTQQLIQERYAEKISQRLKEKGLRSLDELKKINEDRIEADRIKQRELYDELIKKARQKLNPTAQTTTMTHKSQQSVTSPISKSKRYSSPIKPLDSIIDVNKLVTQSASEITKLWAAYHLSTSDPPRMGAVIPTGIYKEMIDSAKKFPSFVIPLAKTSTDPSDKSNSTNAPFEMQYLQWDFVQPPEEPNLPDFLRPKSSVTPSQIPPTIVMYTPLAEYKLRQSFAQPTLILTHYTDLADSHGIVLMRGDITPSPNGNAKISAIEAQMLVLRLQQFYHSTVPINQDQSVHQKRRLLLQQFHQQPDQFQLSELINLVNDL